MSNLVKFSEERIENYMSANIKISEIATKFFANEKVLNKYIYDIEHPVNHHIIVSVAELEQRKIVYVPTNIDDRQMHIFFEDFFRNAKKGEEFVIFHSKNLSQEMLNKIESRGGKVELIY